jgi:hypothetical protein
MYYLRRKSPRRTNFWMCSLQSVFGRPWFPLLSKGHKKWPMCWEDFNGCPIRRNWSRKTRQFYWPPNKPTEKREGNGERKKMSAFSGSDRGCQMANFQTKNPNLGKFWRDLRWKILVYFMAVWSIFTAVWYVFPRFCMQCREKSGNHGSDQHRCLRMN